MIYFGPKYKIQNVIVVYQYTLNDEPVYLKKLAYDPKRGYDIYCTKDLEKARKFNSKKWLDMHLMPRLLNLVRFAKIVKVEYIGYRIMNPNEVTS